MVDDHSSAIVNRSKIIFFDFGLVTIDIGIMGETTIEIKPGLSGGPVKAINAAGQLVIPPFVDSHFHMDATLSLGQPRLNKTSTQLEGIKI